MLLVLNAFELDDDRYDSKPNICLSQVSHSESTYNCPIYILQICIGTYG